MSPFHQPEWNGLLAGVSAAPDDDLPRLVAADWLDDNEEPERAEFIRLQCVLAREAEADANRVGAMRWREHALLVSPTAGQYWAWEACPHIVKFEFTGKGSPLRGLGISGTERVHFRRGFPDRLNCPAIDWSRHGKSVVPRQPLRSLSLTRCDDLPLEDWWNMLPSLAKLQRVTLDGRRAFLASWLRERLPKVEIHYGQRRS